MAKDAKIKVGVDGADEAKRDLDRLTGAEKKVGAAAQDAGQKTKQAGQQSAAGLRKGAAAGDKMRSSLEGLLKGALGLTAVIQLVRQLADAAGEAHEKLQSMGEALANMHANAAGPASQFGVPESQMLKLLQDIGAQSGASSVGALGNLVVAASSSGLISGVTAGPEGGMAQMSEADRGTVAALTMFAERTDSADASGDLVKLVATIGKAKPGTTVNQALGMLEATYQQSQSADWTGFLQGAAGAATSAMSQGASPETALSQYGALIAVTRNETTAAEALKAVAGQTVFGAKDKIVEEFNRRNGPDAYSQLKAQDPDAVYNQIMDMLLEPTGVERDRLYGRLGIDPELKQRLALMGATRGEAGQIRKDIGKGVDVRARNAAWRQDDRAVYQSSQMKAGGTFAEQAAGTPLYAAAVAAAKQQLEHMEATSPVSTWIGEAMNFREGELQEGLYQYLLANLSGEFKKRFHGQAYNGPWDVYRNDIIDFDLENQEIDLSGVRGEGLRDEIRKVLGAPGNVQNNYGGTVINQNDQTSPAGRPDHRSVPE